jgi:hypothetical protein
MSSSKMCGVQTVMACGAIQSFWGSRGRGLATGALEYGCQLKTLQGLRGFQGLGHGF